jgi:hypothetical protein
MPARCFIAAAAERHDLTLVTRNVADFDALGIRLVYPMEPRLKTLLDRCRLSASAAPELMQCGS